VKKLFGTDGIRGIAGKYPLEPDFIKKIGRAAAAIISDSNNEFILGSDSRESSSWISKALSEGLTSAGANVFDCGVVPTPAVSYIISERGHRAAVLFRAVATTQRSLTE